MGHLTPTELAAWLADPVRAAPLLLDVREAWEYQTCRIEGACHMPMQEVPRRLAELDPGSDVVAICHHGVRSMRVAVFLARQGFERVYNLSGGIDAWARSVEPAMPVY
jgi:rhodanese-related sulfurtransferase